MSRNPQRTGKRRRPGETIRARGWTAPVREKVSPYATTYAYEVRLPHAYRWPLSNDPHPYVDLVAALKRSTDCRVVGIGEGSTSKSATGRRTVWAVRVYLKTEADLFQMRLLTNDVFRVYKLKDV